MCLSKNCKKSISQIMNKVVNEITPSKEIIIKNNTQKWFDRDIAELIHPSFKIFLGKRKLNFMKLILNKI